jgi:hypothetical protein
LERAKGAATAFHVSGKRAAAAEAPLHRAKLRVARPRLREVVRNALRSRYT